MKTTPNYLDVSDMTRFMLNGDTFTFEDIKYILVYNGFRVRVIKEAGKGNKKEIILRKSRI